MSEDSFGYKYENIITRKFTKNSRTEPKIPLTLEERNYLTNKYLQDFAKDYKRFAIKMGCLSDDEMANLVSSKSIRGLMNNDLENDGFLLFSICLDKFDKSRYEGKIAEANTQGASGCKTLDFFFMAQGRKMIIWHFRDSLKATHKREKGTVGYGDLDIDGGELEDEHEEDQQEELIKTMLSQEGLRLIRNIVGEKESRSFIAFVFKKKFHLFDDFELKFEYGPKRFSEFEKALERMLDK